MPGAKRAGEAQDSTAAKRWGWQWWLVGLALLLGIFFLAMNFLGGPVVGAEFLQPTACPQPSPNCVAG